MVKLRVAAAILIMGIWAAGYVLAMADRSFTPPPEVSGIMLAAVTWLFGPSIRTAISRPKNNNEGNNDGT